MRFEVEPLLGVGPARLGMHREELRAAMKTVPQSFRKGDRWETDAFFGGGFQVFYGGDEPRVDYIELSHKAGLEPFLYGIDIFATPASELIMRLDQKCRYDRNDPELGSSYTFLDWELSLWRHTIPDDPADDEGRCFSTIGVGARGYFSARAG